MTNKDFNIELNCPELASFMQSFDLFNLIKAYTYFKGKGSWISSNVNKVIRPVLNFFFFLR